MTPAWAAPADGDRDPLPPELVFEAGLRNHHVSNTAYPIAHERTWRPYRAPSRETAEAVARAAWAEVDDLCLYVHVPFCETRCSFCEYTVTRREEHSAAAAHVDDLVREVELCDEAFGLRGRVVHGLDIGGGTPTFLEADAIARILEALLSRVRLAPGAGISIETTPKIAPPTPIAWRRSGGSASRA